MPVSATISYQYADGSANTIRRTGATYPNGRQVSYLYNGLDDRLSRVTAIANSPLGQGMRSYWRLDENVTSGTRFDSIGTNGLADVNSNVGSASGLFGGKAAQFVAANSAFLAATALNGLIYNGQTRFTTAGWIKFNSVSGTIGIWGKGNSGNASYTQQEWVLFIDGSTHQINWILSDGTHYTVLNSNTYAAAGHWYFIVAGYDAVSGRAFVQIDNGTEYSTTSLGPSNRGFEFTIGRTYDHFLSGLVQSVGVWDRVLTSGERTDLYNGGSGFDLQVHAKYTYLGLNTVVKVDYPQPAIGLNLATGSGANPYQGLDRFGRVVDNLWKQYATATTADEIKYGYDRNSNRTFRENPVSKGLSTPKYFDELYANDGLNRLQAMQRGQLTGTPPSGITNQNFGQAWMLDPTGNWGQFQEDATGGGTPTLSQTRVSNEVNEITSITNASPAPAWSQPDYDPAGNMTTVPQPADMTKKYTATFDAWNRLTKLVDPDTGHTVQENQYDGLMRRTVQKTYDSSGALAETRHYYYSSAWQVLEERLGTSTTPDRQFVWGLRYIDDLILRDRSVSGTLDERLFALQDANWNVTAIVNTTGAIQQRFAYSPYGVPMFLNADFTTGSNTKDWETLFCGYRRDKSTSLYKVRFRDLHSDLGIWLTHDPLGLGSGSNLYCNVTSNPINSIDPTGSEEECCDVTSMKLVRDTPNNAGFTTDFPVTATPGFADRNFPGPWFQPEQKFTDAIKNIDPQFVGTLTGPYAQYVLWVIVEGKNLQNCKIDRTANGKPDTPKSNNATFPGYDIEYFAGQAKQDAVSEKTTAILNTDAPGIVAPGQQVGTSATQKDAAGTPLGIFAYKVNIANFKWSFVFNVTQLNACKGGTKKGAPVASMQYSLDIDVRGFNATKFPPSMAPMYSRNEINSFIKDKKIVLTATLQPTKSKSTSGKVMFSQDPP